MRYLRSRGDEAWKVSLVKSLDERGYTGEDREALYWFIDWLLALPEDLEIEYNEELKRYEEEKKMAYVTSAERLGMKKGYRQGFQEGREKGREKGMEEGLEEGIEKGMEEGIEKGMEKGMEKGIEKGIEKSRLEIAGNMKRAGIDISTIAETTGLSREAVENLPEQG